jgi:hypothetical protein
MPRDLRGTEYLAVPPKQRCEQHGMVVLAVVQYDDHAFAA